MGISVNNNTEYGIGQIKTLEGIEAIRLRPGMYVGSVGPAGVRHITLEIISNAVDEYLNGHCTQCDIRVEKDGHIDITDNGRGVPFGKAKFDSDGKTGYNTSGGMNGVGAKATNALSSTFMVTSIRGGKCAIARFEKGELKSYKEEAFDKNVHGTCIRFLPDTTIFKEGIHKIDNKAFFVVTDAYEVYGGE